MKISRNALTVSLFFALVSQPAFAYIDPGTGSMVLQLVVAGVLGALFTIKTWWRHLTDMTKRFFGKS